MGHNQRDLTELMATDLVGGTLVEYKDGTGFNLEYARGKLTRAQISHDGICLNTTSQYARLEWRSLACWHCEKSDGVFYLFHLNMKGYAVASPGIEIPKKQDSAEVTYAQYLNAVQSFRRELTDAVVEHQTITN